MMSKLIRYLILPLIASAAFAQHGGSNPIHVMSAWSRALPPVSQNGAVYLTLKNYSGAADRLVGASSPLAARVEIHLHEMEAGMMTMRRVESVPLNPGEYVIFEPGGKHLMLIGLKRPLKEGEEVPLTLTFERAPPLEVMVPIGAVDAEGPKNAGHQHHQEHGRDDTSDRQSP